MFIKNLSLRQFRNLNNITIEFGRNYNIILGNNAQGKTNILESLFMLSTCKSHRIKEDQSLIQFNYNSCKINCNVFDDSDLNLSLIIHEFGKSLFINKKMVDRVSKFIGKLNVVIFSPGDLNYFEDTPKYRRKIMDIEIGKISQSYMNYLLVYSKYLKDRNALLKSDRVKDEYFEIIEDEMIRAMSEIILFRRNFVDEINKVISKYYLKLSKESIDIKLEYYQVVSDLEKEDIINSLKDLFKKNRDKDEYYKTTTCGIHRDDTNFLFNGKKIYEVASQGQKRMVILSFKLALLHYIKNITGKTPILLLDDVMSELDKHKRINLFNAIPKEIQTIITTTDVDNLIDDINGEIKLFEVKDGFVKVMEDK
ncbi:MAG: DNA replication/repair protein RecF [Anaerorhabdus sp.]